MNERVVLTTPSAAMSIDTSPVFSTWEAKNKSGQRCERGRED